MAVSFVRSLILYVLIIAALKLMGKRQISELQTSELVVALLISDIAAIPMQNTAQPLISGIVPMIALVSFEIILSCIMLKHYKFRRFICGRPIIIVNDGKIDQKEMKRLRMATEDLTEQLRQADVFDINEVAYAIVETNGNLSILKKSKYKEADASMLGVVLPNKGLDIVVVSDGQFADDSMAICQISKDWVLGILKGKNLKVEDIFIMTANKNRDFNIIKKEI